VIAEPSLPAGAIRIFHDGTLGDPQLDHPECVAVAPDGSVWTGGERGQIFRIEPDGSRLEQIASTDGFCLGIAFSAEGDLYVCDLKHAAVFRLAAGSDRPELYADGVDGFRFRVPNYAALDADGRLYVSDSHGFKDPGPGVFRFDADGSGELWFGGNVNFANGLALAPDGRHLYVVETFGRRVFRVPIGDDGAAGAREDVATFPGVLPDGIAFAADGTLYVACYEPSGVIRVSTDGDVRWLVRDDDAHALCHPTNLAFRSTTLLLANLGRWHVSAVELDVEGAPLRPPRQEE
jgi:sugar lactone lactonase YvrE